MEKTFEPKTIEEFLDMLDDVSYLMLQDDSLCLKIERIISEGMYRAQIRKCKNCEHFDNCIYPIKSNHPNGLITKIIEPIIDGRTLIGTKTEYRIFGLLLFQKRRLYPELYGIDGDSRFHV